MFKRDVKAIKELILRNLRAQGLETPLLQKRLMEAGETCALAARSRIDSSGTSWIWPSIKAAICPFVESDLLLTISDRNIIGSLL